MRKAARILLKALAIYVVVSIAGMGPIAGRIAADTAYKHCSGEVRGGRFVAGFVGTSNVVERDGRRFAIRPEKIRIAGSEVKKSITRLHKAHRVPIKREAARYPIVTNNA